MNALTDEQKDAMNLALQQAIVFTLSGLLDMQDLGTSQRAQCIAKVNADELTGVVDRDATLGMLVLRADRIQPGIPGAQNAI
jgi:hypothetical protein